MKRFFEDSSQAKTLSKDSDIHYALKHLGERYFTWYEVRCGDKVLGTFGSRREAKVCKSFKEFELGQPICIVATYGRG